MAFIEIIGFPGSGKTYLFKKITNVIDKKKIKVLRNDKYFFDYFEKNFLDKVLFNSFYKYKINKKFYSKYIFHKQYKFLSNEINLIIKKKKLSKIFTVFKKLLQNSKLNKMGKERVLDNFRIDLCTYYLEAKLNKRIIINDEGLLQKIFMIYREKDNYITIKKKINEYLKLIPMPDFVILLDVNKDLCFERASLRKNGFIYEKKNKKKILSLFIKIMQNIEKILKKNKIKVITINENHVNKKTILKITNNILKI